MVCCVINNCKINSQKSNKSTGITFHKFPTDPIMKEKWIEIVRKNRKDDCWVPSKFSVVCSKHFSEDDTYWSKDGYRRIQKGCCPKKRLRADSAESEDSNHRHAIEEVSCDNPNTSTECDEGMSDTESVDVTAERNLRKRLQKKEEMLKTYKKKVKCLQQRLRRVVERNKTLKSVLKQLIDKRNLKQNIQESVQNA